MLEQSHRLDVLKKLGIQLWSPKDQALDLAFQLKKDENSFKSRQSGDVPVQQDKQTNVELANVDAVEPVVTQQAAKINKTTKSTEIYKNNETNIELDATAQQSELRDKATNEAIPQRQQRQLSSGSPTELDMADIHKNELNTSAPAIEDKYGLEQLSTKATMQKTGEPKVIQADSAQAITNNKYEHVESQLKQVKAKAYHFDWYAITYKNWILVVDDAAINHEKLAALWQNIQIGLETDLKHLHFPLLGSDAALVTNSHTSLVNAKASIAGWMFALKQSTPTQTGFSAQNSATKQDPINFQVGLLTDISDELSTDDMQRLPTLGEMIEDPLLKRQLWRTINQ